MIDSSYTRPLICSDAFPVLKLVFPFKNHLEHQVLEPLVLYSINRLEVYLLYLYFIEKYESYEIQ